MSVDIFPDGIMSPGNNTWIWTAAEPKTLANLTAGTDLSCYFPAGEIEIGFSQERVDDTRGCDSSSRESFGVTTFTREEIVYIYDPQGDGTEPGNLADGVIEENSTGYLSVRMGVPTATAPTAEHKWDVYQVAVGAKHGTALQSGKYVRRATTKYTRIRQGVTFTA